MSEDSKTPPPVKKVVDFGNYQSVSDFAHDLEDKRRIEKENSKTPEQRKQEQKQLDSHNAKAEASNKVISTSLENNPTLASAFNKSKSNLEKMLEENYNRTQKGLEPKHSEKKIELQNNAIQSYYKVLKNPARAKEVEVSLKASDKRKEELLTAIKDPKAFANSMRERLESRGITLHQASLSPVTMAKKNTKHNTR